MRSIIGEAAVALVFCLATGMPQSAIACRTYAPFQIEDIARADVVFTGQLIRYDLVSPGRPNSLDEYALLTVRVDKVLKGNASGDVQLYWWNSTFGVPKKLQRDGRILIAAVSADRTGLPLRGPSATVFPSRRPDLLQVLQAPCSTAFILIDTAKGEENVRAILRGEPAGPYDYFTPDKKDWARWSWDRSRASRKR